MQTEPAPYCPRCCSKMVLFQGRVTLWVCKRYPDCDTTRAITDDGKPELSPTTKP